MGPAWASLPIELLAAVLLPGLVGTSARLVCKRFRSVFDAGMRLATLRPPSPAALVADWPPPPPPHAPAVRLLLSELDLACVGLGPGWDQDDVSGLADALQRWQVAAPLQLDLRGNQIAGVEALAAALRSPAFAAGGLQALDLSANPINDQGLIYIAAALRAASQLSALRELRLARMAFGAAGASALCAALRAATHVRSLALLDLSGGAGSAAALAACLRAAPHVALSLQQLAMAGVGMDGAAAAALAGAVADAGVRLTALDLSENSVGDQGAAAWAVALSTASCLSGLESFDLRRNRIGDIGMAALVDSLLDAMHLTRLHRLGLFPGNWTQAAAGQVERLLQAAPHLARLQELDLRGCDLSGGAMAVVGRALGAGCALPALATLRLRGARLSGAQGVRDLCSALVSGTRLSGLRELDLREVAIGGEDSQALAAALTAATHLALLRRLSLGAAPLGKPQRLEALLRGAPHLRGLTALSFCSNDPGREYVQLSGLCLALELVPHLRSLAVHDIDTCRPAHALELAAVLQRAPCVPSLEDLAIGAATLRRGVADWAVMHLSASLQGCARLCGLRSLELSFPGLSHEGLVRMGRALGACSHLAGLRELRLGLGGDGGDERWEAERRHKVYRLLAAGQLAGVRVARSAERAGWLAG